MHVITKSAIIVFTLLLVSGRSVAQTTKQDTLRELVRKVDILTQELEKEKLGEITERKYESKFGLGPAASQVYHKKGSGVSLAGYGEIVYQNYKDNATASGTDQIDYLRNVLYVGHKFNDHFLFNAEIEIEHAVVSAEDPGEVAIEFGYIEAMLTSALTLRAGMVLVPVGIINEFHEPSTFYGTLRPETERAIIPATWRANGIGFVGASPHGLGYRVYLLEGLNASEFSASGIRSGRQEGAEATAKDFALAGRVEYTGIIGLNVGTSIYSGPSGQGMMDDAGNAISARTTVFAAHGVFARHGLEIRALYAYTAIADVRRLNSALAYGGAESIGERQFGYYMTVAYDILQHVLPGTAATLQPFFQYEKLDTQSQVPSVFAANPANERANATFGVMYKPIPQIAFKADYIDRSNKASTGLSQFNLAVSYLF